MPREPENTSVTPSLSADRLWAEQLALGMAMLVGLLTFMALFHPDKLAVGGEVLGPNYLSVYGWASAFGITLQVVVHEGGTLLAAWLLGIPLSFRFFGFGANATAILEYQPRRPWIDALVGFAGPLTGTVVSLLLAGLFLLMNDPNNPQTIAPYFLGMACVGYFYNLFTLIPVLDLEGGWISPIIAPQSWFLGLIAVIWTLTMNFNLVLVCVFSFALPRLLLIILARMPRADLPCTRAQVLLTNIGYFAMVIGLAWLGTYTFQALPELIRDAMGD